MALGLTLTAVLVCGVKLLSPERLTPIVVNFANSSLNARVSLSRAELSFDPAFPVLRLRLDSLTVMSKAFDSLPSEERNALPSYADSLFTLDRFDGVVDVGALLARGEISVRNVELVRPGLNIVLNSGGTANFDIYHSTDTVVAEQSESTVIPPFSIKKFSMTEPREIRYFNAADSVGAAIVLFRDVHLDGDNEPLYRIGIDGRIMHPLLRQFLNSDDMRFGLDGKVRWEPARPQMLAFEEFSLYGAFIKAKVDAALAFDSTLTVSSASFVTEPVSIADAMELIPSDIRRKNRLDSINFQTDAAIAFSGRLTRPFRAAVDSIPYADIEIRMPDSKIRYGKAVFHKAAVDVDVSLRGNDLDSALIDIRRIAIAGPATDLSLKAKLSRIVSDPAFDACLKGNTDIAKLPPIVADLAGAYISGKLSMDIDGRGSLAMFEKENFHRLDIRGRLKGRNLYYLANDTNVMADVDGLDITFGSQSILRTDSTASNPTLTARIAVDTTNILIDGISMRASGLTFGAGVENTGLSADTTRIVPIGGALKMARLDIESITDTAGVRLRGLDGTLILTRFHGDKHAPLISAKLDVKALAAGTPDTRFMLGNAKIRASLHKKPQSDAAKAFKKAADSIRTLHPELSPDSVYALALARRRRHPGEPRRKRVELRETTADIEMIEWDLSKGLRRFLLGWDLKGSLTTRRARLFTPLFPLRNRVRNLDISFTSDSVILNNVKYKAGSSDLTVNGLISNIRRGLTSKRPGRNTLKINFDINSDTIDVNQLSAAVFAGAAYAERLRKGVAVHNALSSDDEDALQQQLDALVSEHADTVGPLLVPANIDARITVESKHVLYSDIAFNNLRGEIMAYQGALNLHNLEAQSDVGTVDLSALYSAPKASDIRFGFDLDLQRFKIERFLSLVPALDSIMPLMRDFSGIINAQIAATVDIDSTMNMNLPTLDAAVRLSGDSLALINPDTYRTLGKWLRFKDKADNKIKHMNVELIVRDNQMQIFPFEFDIDRYRLGVAGSNDLALNFKYHIAVLKSPLPFKFGINISGNPDKYKVRFGGSKFKPGMAVESIDIVDTARVNLIRQIEGVFRRGVGASRFARLNLNVPATMPIDERETALSHADSLAMIREGLIDAPKEVPAQEQASESEKKRNKKNSKKLKSNAEATNRKH